MCSDCEGDDLDELRAHLVDDGTISGSSSSSSSSSSSGEGQRAMSDERLAAIRQLSFHQEKYAAGEMGQTDSIDVDAALVDLLAEVERLRAREAALVEMVKRLVAPGVAVRYDHAQTAWHCVFCDVIMNEPHASGCPVSQARALLASTAEQEA